ncbi:DUF6445 family protein [Roseateles asaccharophilus]|uniref:Uncharacterized protein n=1 Tax=Roseateles asaccharophilus TaxID=582607 RepID=A0ABU2A5B9_9BURK|nr:DUF6445 family protein [Roseateles asaccharophilus]MDR7332320.1 hypothetical protein [Roseateles asaccharophilus]
MNRLFNPQPRVQVLEPAPGLRVVVLDDVLLQPERVVAWAQAHRFEAAEGNLYPGDVLGLPDEFDDRLRDLFWQHARGPLALRRCQAAYVRLAMATTPAARLQPLQWLCHRDRIDEDVGAMFAASVLYLFHDAALGGTRFFAPRRPGPELAQLFRDAQTLQPADFTARHGISPGYPAADMAYFDCVASVPAAWNRMIIYDGGGYHAAAIDHPELLSNDPATGRLTLNGFFPCRRQAAPAQAR